MTVAPVGLVVAKAPVPGRVKTRLAASVGAPAAAQLAAAALLDTIEACEAAFDRCYLALCGDLTLAVDSPAILARTRRWTLLPQRGSGFAERLVNAHADVGRVAQAGVVQVGMDTPQVGPTRLRAVAEQLKTHDAVLGPAEDGGWWVLGLRHSQAARALTHVPMSNPRTGTLTHAALKRHGLTVASTAILRDVDNAEDAAEVAASAPHTRFAAVWRATRTTPQQPR